MHTENEIISTGAKIKLVPNTFFWCGSTLESLNCFPLFGSVGSRCRTGLGGKLSRSRSVCDSKYALTLSIQKRESSYAVVFCFSKYWSDLRSRIRDFHLGLNSVTTTQS